jgi:hypothetical protein
MTMCFIAVPLRWQGVASDVAARGEQAVVYPHDRLDYIGRFDTREADETDTTQ